MKLPPVVGHLQLADEFQRLLDSGEAPTRTCLARRYGLTKPRRVTQLMDLLLLHPDILDYVRNLPPGTPDRLVTEKKLRRIVKLAPEPQLSEAEKQVPGFAAHRTSRKRAVG
ncbi:MAG: hypothetical protein ACKV2T_00245 [Kofleriaceae bacterium]